MCSQSSFVIGVFPFMNTLEHVWVQLWLNVSHRARLSVSFAINHVDNTVVLHCLNISNVTQLRFACIPCHN